MRNRLKALLILCLIISVLTADKLWFTKAVKAETDIHPNESVEDFKKEMDDECQNGSRPMVCRELQLELYMMDVLRILLPTVMQIRKRDTY